MLELGDKGIKMIIITVSHMLKKLVDPWKKKKPNLNSIDQNYNVDKINSILDKQKKY